LIREGEWNAKELETRKNLLNILKINYNSVDPINEAVLQKVLEEFRVKLLEEIHTK
jgi:hypothetical protein